MLLPENDAHFMDATQGKDFYQRRQLLMAMAFCSDYRVAIDAGAHVGFMSRDMALLFDTVYAFEPDKNNFECLVKNTPSNVVCANNALGLEKGKGYLTTPWPENTGAWELTVGDGDVEIMSIDDLHLDEVDFIKIDTQGDDLDILHGAGNTLAHSKPVVLIEIPRKDISKEEATLIAIEAAKLHDYKLFFRFKHDGIFLHKTADAVMWAC